MNPKGVERRVAVLGLPGSNCEVETRLALTVCGVEADVVRWNEDPQMILQYAGFILPAGFSYQDRVRAGALAAKETVVEIVGTAVGEGKPVMGICNGCQVLVEAGLIPGTRGEEVEMAVAPNRRFGGRGFYCGWVFVKHEAVPGRCLFTRNLGEGEVFPVPIAHAEGRFTTVSSSLVAGLRERDQIVFRYCDSLGRVSEDPEVNPNGSMDNIAGLCNPQGNVLALMPHPERATWLRQVPEGMPSVWADRKSNRAGDWKGMEGEGPGRRLFEAFRRGVA